MIKKKEIYNSWYHGTTSTIAVLLKNGEIDISKGGGELGKGFYMGNFISQAKTWAFYKNNKRRVPNSIVQFNFNTWISFKYQIIGKNRRNKLYPLIKSKGEQRSYTFNLDFVYCKVLGVEVNGFYQLKWESIKGQEYLNNKAYKKLI